jgi:tetratricopeptide (TPR) repeat protein
MGPSAAENLPAATPAEQAAASAHRHAFVVELAISVALAALTLLVYGRTGTFPFVAYDDGAYVFENQQVQGGLSAAGVRWAFTTFACANWHPLTWLSLQLDWQLFGGQPAGFHLTNVVLHTANTLLLFGVLTRLTGAVWRSAVVAALFALHPLHVESVAWVSERKDVLSTLFWMLTLAAYVSYVRRPGVCRYLLVLLALGLGLLAKPMLVTLPFVLLLLDYWPLRRWPDCSLRHLLLEKAPLFVLVLASCVVTYLAQLRGQAVAPLEAFPLAARLENALLAYTGYLGKMLWPTHLAVYYPHPRQDVSGARALGAGLFLVVITVLVLGPGRRRPYLAVGWLWYLGTLVPVIGLVQVGGQAMADRYTYVPLIGLFLLLVWGVADLAEAYRVPHRSLAGAAALVLSACVVLTWVQVGHWKSTLRLWEHTVAVTENNFMAHVTLGTHYYQQGMLSDARREFKKALALDPGVAEPHANLAKVYGDLGLGQQAVAEYRQAVALDPQNPVFHNNLGSLLRDLGRPEEALAESRRAIALDPTYVAPHNNLGIVFAELGRHEEALAEFRRAIVLDPTYAQLHNNLGIVLADLGRLEEAQASLRRAIALDQAYAAPHTNLGRVLQEEGRLEEALAEYQRALELGDKQAGPRLQACERLRALLPRLPALLAGRDQPADNAERLAFAELCRQRWQRRYALAARLYRDAFAADARLAELRTANRFHAAAAAAAAGCGQGRGGARLGEGERAELRRQALSWLQADLALWAEQAGKDVPQARAAAGHALRTWQRHPNLAGVRDRPAIARLPQAEREGWQKLWQDVRAVLSRARLRARQPLREEPR